MIHKGGDAKELDNYRGIAISSNISKIFTKLYANRLERHVESRGLLGEMQFGFRKGRSCLDAVFLLAQLV